jgi:diaminohydroxyphosphoribosylaminopyrimidine deaminase / 5-amino-6-(5-phosphoribosylamino)uracil reductase
MNHHRWMGRALELAHRCPASATAFSVGAVVVDDAGREIAHGFSRDNDPQVHAEESALLTADADCRLYGATMYSTLEPCSNRTARPDAACTSLIVASGISKVVIAWREPDLFVACEGVTLLIAAGIEVVELPEFADRARAVNAHLGW